MLKRLFRASSVFRKRLRCAYAGYYNEEHKVGLM